MINNNIDPICESNCDIDIPNTLTANNLDVLKDASVNEANIELDFLVNGKSVINGNVEIDGNSSLGLLKTQGGLNVSSKRVINLKEGSLLQDGVAYHQLYDFWPASLHRGTLQRKFWWSPETYLNFLISTGNTRSSPNSSTFFDIDPNDNTRLNIYSYGVYDFSFYVGKPGEVGNGFGGLVDINLHSGQATTPLGFVYLYSSGGALYSGGVRCMFIIPYPGPASETYLDVYNKENGFRVQFFSFSIIRYPISQLYY